MNQRTLIDRLLSPAGFGLVLLLFLLPFVTVSCGVRAGEATANFDQSFSFTGLDLLVGGSPDIRVSGADAEDIEEVTGGSEVMEVFDERYGKYYPPQPVAIIAAVTIVAGMVAGLFLPLARRAWPSAAAAVIAAILLAIEVFFIAPGQADDAIADALGGIEGAPEAIASGALTSGTNPGLGFWTAMVILVVLAAWQAHVAYHGPTAQPEDSLDEEEPPDAEMPMVPPAGGPATGAASSDGG